ncbi:MAG: Gfo/Idh/MocA family oxidoreductase [Oligosphaeraceae bacterium]|nr:Gfo/Idh/MocA family oxidoreductase [Oligosphaeraceae bacterium]
MSNNLRIGIIGLGLRGRHFAWLTSKVPGLALTAVCDLTQDKWHLPSLENDRPLNETFPDTRFFENSYDLLDSGLVDAVIIETPASQHVTFCEAALQRNLHVFGEIPPVADLHEALRLWNTERASKGMFMTGANPNRWGFVKGLKDFAEAGLLGEPFYLEAEYIHDCRDLWEQSPWRRDEDSPIKYCTHSLGPLLMIMKEDLRTVSCLGTGCRIAQHADDDLMTAHFATPGKVIVRITISFVNANRFGMHSYRVFGTHGCFERLAERGSRPAEVFFNSDKLYGLQEPALLAVDKEPVEYRKRPDILSSGHNGVDYDLLSAFASAIRAGNGISPISLKEGLRMTLPGLYAAVSASRGGELLQIRYPWDDDFDEDALD